MYSQFYLAKGFLAVTGIFPLRIFRHPEVVGKAQAKDLPTTFPVSSRAEEKALPYYCPR